MTTSRRDVLRGAGLAALLGTTGLAGCSGSSFLSDGSGGGDGVTSWQYDPSTLAETENRFFGSMDYEQIYENRQFLPESTQSDFETDSDSPVAAEDIGQITGVGGGRYAPRDQSGAVFGSMALTGEFTTEDFTESIDDESDTERIGEYEGYVLYENAESSTTVTDIDSSQSAVVGLTDGTLVMGIVSQQQSGVDVTGEDAAKQMIDASQGNAPLLRDNSEYASQLTDAVDGESMRFGGEIDPELVATMQQVTDPASAQFFDGVRASGFGMTIDGETTTFSFTGIYESGEAADETGLVGVVDGGSERAIEENEGLDSLEASRSGAAITIEMEGQTQTIFESDVPAGTTANDETFSL